MDLHLRQQFDYLLATSVERFVERLEHRNEGLAHALRKLESDENGEGVWLHDFVNAVFADFLLDNVEGACFVLQALAQRPHDALQAGRISEILIDMSKSAFGSLLKSKTLEALQQRSAYQSVDTRGP